MGKRSKRTFTKRTIDSVRGGSEKGTWYADRDHPGFLLRVYADGTKTFSVRYTVRGTTIRRTKSLGRYGTVTLDQAREDAIKILSAAQLGGDPLGKAATVPTWGEWSETFFDRLTAKSKETFHRLYLGFTAETKKRTKKATPTDPTFREIRARWAARPLSSFTPDDIEAERHALREAKSRTIANRWLAVVAACFQAAVRAEIIERNPASKVKADREAAPRARTLSTDEMRRLLAAWETERTRDPWGAIGVLLAILTGARRGEVLALRWEDVRLDEGFARLPDSKSGKPRYLALPARAVEELRALPRLGSFVVAPGREPKPTKDGKPAPERPRPDLKGPWERLTKAAGLEGVTFHDLRRTFGRELNRAAGLRVAAEALGHAAGSPLTATTYTPEGFEAVREAAEKRANLLPFPQRPAATPAETSSPEEASTRTRGTGATHARRGRRT